VVVWVRRELVPRLVERWRPTRIIAFDPPDRPASLGDAPVGLLVVSLRFEGVAVVERVERLRGDLSDVGPVRPLCLTPEEFRLSAQVPGPVLAAARTGIDLL
jgi:hypothetical protein